MQTCLREYMFQQGAAGVYHEILFWFKNPRDIDDIDFENKIETGKKKKTHLIINIHPF